LISSQGRLARIIGLGLLAGLGAVWVRAERGGFCLTGAPSNPMSAANVSAPAPDVTIRTAQGDRRLSDLRGKVVLVDFWATWCGPCRESIPKVVDLYRTRHDRGLEVLGVSLDGADSVVASFGRDQRIPYPLGRPASETTVSEYGADAIPTMVLVDKQGRIRWRQTGYSEDVERELTAQVDALLKE
jgi:peroxiredoxin